MASLPTKKMKSMGTQPLVYIHGILDCFDVWYRIDVSESSEVNISLVAEMNFEGKGSWTAIGEDLYWAGGVRYKSDRQIDVVSRELYKHNTKSSRLVEWDVVSSTKKIRWCNPCIFHLDDKIYVLGGEKNHFQPSDNREKYHHSGEVYDPASQSWEFVFLGLHEFTSITGCNTVLMDGEENKPPVLVCLSTSGLLFCDVRKDSFLFDDHPNFWVVDESTFRVMTNVKPVVSKSIFYWFNQDLNLCGYHIHHKKWLPSISLKEKLSYMGPYYLLEFPAFVNLCDGDFLVIFCERIKESSVAGGLKKLSVARITVLVSIDEESFDVLVGKVSSFSVQKRFHLMDGITTMLKNIESSTMHGESSSAMEI